MQQPSEHNIETASAAAARSTQAIDHSAIANLKRWRIALCHASDLLERVIVGSNICPAHDGLEQRAVLRLAHVQNMNPVRRNWAELLLSNEIDDLDIEDPRWSINSLKSDVLLPEKLGQIEHMIILCDRCTNPKEDGLDAKGFQRELAGRILETRAKDLKHSVLIPKHPEFACLKSAFIALCSTAQGVADAIRTANACGEHSKFLLLDPDIQARIKKTLLSAQNSGDWNTPTRLVDDLCKTIGPVINDSVQYGNHRGAAAFASTVACTNTMRAKYYANWLRRQTENWPPLGYSEAEAASGLISSIDIAQSFANGGFAQDAVCILDGVGSFLHRQRYHIADFPSAVRSISLHAISRGFWPENYRSWPAIKLTSYQLAEVVNPELMPDILAKIVQEALRGEIGSLSLIQVAKLCVAAKLAGCDGCQARLVRELEGRYLAGQRWATKDTQWIADLGFETWIEEQLGALSLRIESRELKDLPTQDIALVAAACAKAGQIKSFIHACTLLDRCFDRLAINEIDRKTLIEVIDAMGQLKDDLNLALDVCSS